MKYGCLLICLLSLWAAGTVLAYMGLPIERYEWSCLRRYKPDMKIYENFPDYPFEEVPRDVRCAIQCYWMFNGFFDSKGRMDPWAFVKLKFIYRRETGKEAPMNHCEYLLNEEDPGNCTLGLRLAHCDPYLQ